MVKNVRIFLKIEGVNEEVLQCIFDKVKSLDLKYNLIRGYDEINEEMPVFSNYSEGVSWYLNKYMYRNDCNRQNSIHFFQKELLSDMANIYRFGIRILDDASSEIFLESEEPDLDLTKFRYYEQFFYDLYRSLPGQVSYKSFVSVAQQNKFYRTNGLLDIMFSNEPFFNASFFYRVITPQSVYGKWHSKEQLLSAPFYSIKELEDEILEIRQFELPFSKDSKEQIVGLRFLLTYLSENNTYPDDFKALFD